MFRKFGQASGVATWRQFAKTGISCLVLACTVPVRAVVNPPFPPLNKKVVDHCGAPDRKVWWLLVIHSPRRPSAAWPKECPKAAAASPRSFGRGPLHALHHLAHRAEDALLHFLVIRTGQPVIGHGVRRFVAAFLQHAQGRNVGHHVVRVAWDDDAFQSVPLLDAQHVIDTTSPPSATSVRSL